MRKRAEALSVLITANPAGNIGWLTPSMLAGESRIQNSVTADGASSVITILSSAAPSSYDFHLELPTGAGAAACAFLARTGPAAPILVAGCGASIAEAVIQANRAQNRGMCLKIKYAPGPSPIWWPDIYRGGHCM